VPGRLAFNDVKQTGTIALTQLGLIMPNTMTLNTVMTTLQRTMRHSPAFDIVSGTDTGATSRRLMSAPQPGRSQPRDLQTPPDYPV
jgi:hypothetical protein